MNIEKIHELFLSCDHLSTDTRKIKNNTFFVALKGDKFDANTFAKEALENGASYVLIDNDKYYIDNRTILVGDALKTLQELASFHRHYLNIPIVALTGSNGKTTTKELIHAVLSEKFNAKATVGNLNNHIGVPLTLLSFDKNTEIGIVEMGANHQKEIEFLCQIAQPDFGYITNFGKAHLEGFGGVEGIIKGKSEMYQYLKANDKLCFLNLDDAIQLEKSINLKHYSFGVNNNDANVMFDLPTASPLVKVSYKDVQIASHLIGLYNSSNIMAAVTIGLYFGVDINKAKNAIENYIPSNNRSQLMEKNGHQIILDAYNANPSSMNVAIDNFAQLSEENKWMILGDMFELGDESQQEHQAIIQKVLQLGDVPTVFVGQAFYDAQIPSENIYYFKTFDELKSAFHKLQFHKQYILIKGSRGMALERVLDLI